MLSVAFLMLVVASVAYCQKNCCYPDKWEGTEGLISGSADDEGHGAITMGNARISMDATMQAVYTDEIIVTGGMNKEYKVLQLFAQNAQYIIFDNKCTRTAVGTWSEASHCVPDNATMLRQYNFGNKDALHVTEYSINNGQTTVELGVTDDCVPAVRREYGIIEGTNILTVSGFFNLTTGIKDPSVFTVPDICKQTSLTTQLPAVAYRRKRSLFSAVV